MNIDCRLIIGCGREYLRLFSRNSGISVYNLGANAAHGFDTQGKRGHVEKQNVFNFTAKHATLYSRTDCNAFVRVNTLERLFSGNFSYGVYNARYTSGSADKNYFVYLRRSKLSVA